MGRGPGRAIVPAMIWQLRIALLLAALFLAGASSKGGGGAAVGAGPLRPERDPALNHPALRVLNRGEELLKIRLQGPVRRDVLAPPGEVTRTLLAAGVYRYEVWRGDRVLSRGVLRLERGHRYHLEVSP